MRLVISKGAEVNYEDNNGVTPLMISVFRRNKEIVSMLISSGAKCNVADKLGNTALDYANDFLENNIFEDNVEQKK